MLRVGIMAWMIRRVEVAQQQVLLLRVRSNSAECIWVQIVLTIHEPKKI